MLCETHFSRSYEGNKEAWAAKKGTPPRGGGQTHLMEVIQVELPGLETKDLKCVWLWQVICLEILPEETTFWGGVVFRSTTTFKFCENSGSSILFLAMLHNFSILAPTPTHCPRIWKQTYFILSLHAWIISAIKAVECPEFSIPRSLLYSLPAWLVPKKMDVIQNLENTAPNQTKLIAAKNKKKIVQTKI